MWGNECSINLPFTKEQLDLLYKIMRKFEVFSTSCAFALSGTFKTTSSASSILYITLGLLIPSQPLTRLKSLMFFYPTFIFFFFLIGKEKIYWKEIPKERLKVYNTYIPCSSKQKVWVTNGSLTSISGKGNVLVTHNHSPICFACPKYVL